MKRLQLLAAENVRGILVVTGAAWLYVGIAGFSRHAADVAAGALLVAIGVFPYLRLKRKG